LIFEAIKKILEGKKKGKMAEVMSMAVWSHNIIVFRTTNITPFWLLFGVEAVMLNEIKRKGSQTMAEASPYPTKAEDKDLLDSDMLKVISNLQKYQDETKAWSDAKVKPKAFRHG
jgi:hypothetical protein